jgi:hypothetical protein
MAQRRMQTERLHDISKYIKRILFLCLTLIWWMPVLFLMFIVRSEKLVR